MQTVVGRTHAVLLLLVNPVVVFLERCPGMVISWFVVVFLLGRGGRRFPVFFVLLRWSVCWILFARLVLLFLVKGGGGCGSFSLWLGGGNFSLCCLTRVGVLCSPIGGEFFPRLDSSIFKRSGVAGGIWCFFRPTIFRLISRGSLLAFFFGGFPS